MNLTLTCKGWAGVGLGLRVLTCKGWAAVGVQATWGLLGLGV